MPWPRPKWRGRQTSAEELRTETLRAIDEGFKELLGDSCSRAVYYYFHMRTGLRVEDVVDRPEALVGFLREMFGAGAQVLERGLVKRLCAKFGINPRDVEGADLASLIKALTSKE